ncbi:MAG: Transcriptional regulator, TetR family [Labilithrix sp.]|nr:Transcriptional regulator, TetR family [Labilithrix sp.]
MARTGKTTTDREGDTRARLVVAARDLFLEGGAASFSLREVARRVGLSAAGVYRHFDGKEALVAAACMQGFTVFSSYLVRALDAPDPLARLLATGDQYRRFALGNPLDYRFIFMSAAEDIHKGDGPATGPPSSTFRFLVDRVRECMDARVLVKADAEKVALVIWAHVHGLVSLRLSGHLSALGDDEAFAAFYGGSVEGLLRGLGR